MKPETVSDTTEFNQIIVDISSSNCMPNTICTVFILIFAFYGKSIPDIIPDIINILYFILLFHLCICNKKHDVVVW